MRHAGFDGCDRGAERRQKIRVNAEFFSADYAGMAELYLFLL